MNKNVLQQRLIVHAAASAIKKQNVNYNNCANQEKLE